MEAECPPSATSKYRSRAREEVATENLTVIYLNESPLSSPFLWNTETEVTDSGSW